MLPTISAAILLTLLPIMTCMQIAFAATGNDSTTAQPPPPPPTANITNYAKLRTGVDQAEMLPMAEALVGSVSQIHDLPVFPERTDAVYFIVAVAGGAKAWGRTLARTLLDMGPPFGSPQGPPLRPIYVDLPQNGRFSAKVLTSLCQQSDDQPLAGIIVIGEGQSARAVALAGSSMNLPVLWAKGGAATLHGIQREIKASLQSMLQPSAREILDAIRALFIQTHWHSFFVLSDVGATMILAGSEGETLKQPPLVPTILPLPANTDDVFRQLAQISRSTRGVVLLLCELPAARRIMSEAQRLNMVGGHFIWLWMDSSSTTAEFFDAYHTTDDDRDNNEPMMKRSQTKSGETFDGDDKTVNYQHREELRERKMDFEDFESLRRKTARLPDRYILGLTAKKDVSEETVANGGERHKRQQSRGNNEELSWESRESDETHSTTESPMEPDVLASFEFESESSYQEPDVPNTKPKRTSYKKNATTQSQSHVFFHHFKDFPVGLLAMRPVRMDVDRHFIRSAMRLFSSTWARVEADRQEDEYSYRLKSSRERQRDRDGGNRWDIGQENGRRNNGGGGGSGTRFNKNSRGDKRWKFETNTRSKRESRNVTVTTNQVNTSNFNTSDLNRNLSSSSSENTSGLYLNLTTSNNRNSNETQVVNDTQTKPVPNKRQNAWWSVRENKWQTKDIGGQQRERERERGPSRRGGAPQYRGGCFGNQKLADIQRSENFAKALKQSVQMALSGQRLADGVIEKPLITHFELLNLVPDNSRKATKPFFNFQPAARPSPISMAGLSANEPEPTKWRRVGLVSGTTVHLDTIVWPGGDIVVSGLSARARSVFRIVTTLAPPFVMESALDEDGLCLRGLQCHRLSTSGRHNLTLLFNAIETRDRLREDAVEHGNEVPKAGADAHSAYRTKCCYGLSMDLLSHIANELGFEFHLYIVRDELFGSRHRKPRNFSHREQQNQQNQQQEQQQQQQQHQQQGNNRMDTSAESNQYDKKQSGDNDANNDGKYGVNPSQKHNKYDRNASKREYRDQWNGIIGELVSGSADMSFAPLSVSRARAEVIDFSTPYYHSGVSLLAAPQSKSEIPLLAFLLPFSPELWIAIFTSLNVTAVAVAIYEWLSPFGLNPWGRQRSKNFSMSSALWVMWGLLCGHLVAFKAPKSWPNKFLINVWGGFSVIFVASYTANIAALIAGLFFHNAAHNYDGSLLTQRVGAPIATAAEHYVQKNDQHLWEHMKRYSLVNVEDGIRRLKNGTLDLLMADSPILDYYRATDHGCNLQRIGEKYIEDTYAIGMTKGFPLRDSISALIAKYSSNGYLDILAEKWYGGLPCFKFEADIVQPRPLGVAAVAGVFILLGLGMVLGVLILIFEHLFYKYTLPILRHKPKGTVWRSRNIMFFSQKLYRFINCVELVSPHHAARELVHTLRQGQIASLFQKSIKRKEDEQRRRRKSKAQFFEMIQEIRRHISRVQQEERDQPMPTVAEVDTGIETAEIVLQDSQQPPPLPPKPKPSPKPKLFSLRKEGRSRSNSSGLNVRRFSTDSILGERLDTIGRRLSRDITYSPPDLSRHFETFGKGAGGEKFDTFSGTKSNENLSDKKFDTFNGRPIEKEDNVTSTRTTPTTANHKKHNSRRQPLNLDLYQKRKSEESLVSDETRVLTPVNEDLEPPIFKTDRSKAELRDKLHKELKAKYGVKRKTPRENNVPPDEVKPPLPKKNIQKRHHRQRSLDALETPDSTTRPVPSPRNFKRELESQLSMQFGNGAHGKHISLERLSREDLLKLSQSSQSEIHKYLENSTGAHKRSEPP